MLQAQIDTKDVQNLIHTLSVVVDAASLNLHDKNILMGLIQSSADDDEEEDDDDMAAPAAKVYESHSESIVDVIEDLKQKAVQQLSESRKEEANARHNFDMMKQSLEDRMRVDSKEL